MASMLHLAGGRRAKWVVMALWFVAIVIAAGPAQLPTKFQDAEKNESASFLPGDAESTKALEAAERLQDGEQAPIVVVYRRDGGLTPDDRQAIDTQIGTFNAERERRANAGEIPFRSTTPLNPEYQLSPDGTTAIVGGSITGNGESDTILDPVDALREITGKSGGGLQAKVTGPAGFAADAIKVFESINGTLLLAAAGLVFILLILIYRSPIFFWIPLIAVAFAELATRSIGYGLTELGVTVNGQSSSILSVLVLGAGTDYALLLVSRYREELYKHQDKHEAVQLALRTAGPAIAFSGLTVILALLTLSVAELNGTAGLGPVGALGIAVAMVTMLTLLPAMLALTGRKAFWPFVPIGPEGIDLPREKPRPALVAALTFPFRMAFRVIHPITGRIEKRGVAFANRHRAGETTGMWRRIGDRVSVNPRRVWIGTAAVLGVLALGLLNFSDGLTTANSYREDVEAVEGQELLSQAFPGGANAPADVIVPDAAKVPAVVAALKEAEGVADAFPNPQTEPGPDGTLVNAVLEPDPYTTEAFELVPGLRRVAKEAGGSEVLVGGASAVEYDVRESAARDTKVIVPLALLVVFLTLIGLLRALVAPLLLIATVILSFAASLGVGAIVFDVIFGFPGSDPSLPLFAFVFLVALGIDYNIFLMARVREETFRHGTRQGMLRGLAVTGGVITSAGIVLAGTFSVLAVLPLVFLTEIGFVIAFGVLLDTFIVRSVLVPALVLDAGKKVWWPSKLAETDGGHPPPPGDPTAPPERDPVAV